MLWASTAGQIEPDCTRSQPSSSPEQRQVGQRVPEKRQVGQMDAGEEDGSDDDRPAAAQVTGDRRKQHAAKQQFFHQGTDAHHQHGKRDTQGQGNMGPELLDVLADLVPLRHPLRQHAADEGRGQPKYQGQQIHDRLLRQGKAETGEFGFGP